MNVCSLIKVSSTLIVLQFIFVTIFQIAIEVFKAAQARSGKANLAADLISKAQRYLAEAQKDNDFIYHERIPDAKSLQPIGRAALAKALPLSPKLSSHFKGQ